MMTRKMMMMMNGDDSSDGSYKEEIKQWLTLNIYGWHGGGGGGS